MANVYLDSNGTVAGFGTLTQSLQTGNYLNGSGNSNGSAVVTPQYFSVANENVLNLGSLSTSLNTLPGTISITGNTRAINVSGLVFQNMPAGNTNNQTITNSGFPLGSVVFVGTNPFCQVTAAGKLVLDTLVSGTINWEKRGASTLQLLKDNNFSGGMTISAGTVEIGNASALGTGTVTMTGGKLSSSSVSSWFVGNAFSVSGNVSFFDSVNTGYIATSGDFNIAAPISLTLNAAQQLYVSGALNSTNSAATLSLLGPSGCIVRFVGAQGTFNSQITIDTNVAVHLSEYATGTPNQFNSALAVTLNANSRLTYYGNTGTSVPYSISGTGTLTIANPQTTTFGGTVTQSGPFEMIAGNGFLVNQAQKVVLSNAASFGTAQYYALLSDGGATYTNLTQTIEYTGAATATNSKIIYIDHGSNNGGTFIYSNNSNNSTLNHTGQIRHNRPTLSETFDINAVNGPMTFSSTSDAIFEAFTGILSVKKTGAYAASINGTGNYRGSVSVETGTLNANSATALGLATSTAAVSVTSGATLSLGAAATYSSRSLTVGGSGVVTNTTGALVIANTGTSTFGGITLGSTTYIRATNSGQINAPFTTNNNSIIFGASAGSDFTPFASLLNVFSGTGSVTYGSHSGDTGIVRADVRHIYTGNTTLAFGTTYVDSTKELAATGGPLGNKLLTAANTLLMTGGTLSYLDGNVDYSGRLSTAGSQQWKIDAAGKTITFATALSGASSLSLSDTSTGGSLTLSSASSTFSGGVTITSGTLYAGAAQSGVSGPLGITGTITFSTGGTGVLAYTSASATFDYSSRFATTANQTRRINANGESVTFLTGLGGLNALALVGSTGILTLAVANTYTQGTTLSVGTLKCGNAASLGTGGLAQANGTTLHVTATGGKLTIQGAHTNTGTGNRTIRIGA